MAPKVRLHVDQPLAAAATVALGADRAHYLFGVMRLGPGARVALFNGRDGEWEAEVAEAGKRRGALVVGTQTRPQAMPPDLWLVFAPVKKARTDFIVEKAVELGVRRLVPVQTEFTNSERIRRDRLQAHAVEAAEQCGATFVPEVAELGRLEAVLGGWPGGRALHFCDEARGGAPLQEDFAPPPAAILIGPEGGFSDPERARIGALPEARGIGLGPRILRADTAAAASLALWQAAQGDWR